MPLERMEATCNREKEHESPSLDCTCGIYTFKTPEQIRTDSYNYQAIYGELWLWGKVIEHYYGYRAQFAYPKKFYVPEEKYILQFKDVYNKISARYMVEFEVIDNSHPIFCETFAEIQAREKRQRAAQAAKQAAILEKRQATLKRKTVLENAVARLPATDLKCKNLLEQIEAEDKSLVAEQL